MSEPSYTLYADRPVWKKVPWWAWVVGVGALLLLLARRQRASRDFEDYLR